MKRFRKILTVYDNSIGCDDAFGQAVALAQANSAHLSVLTVLPERDVTPGMMQEAEKRLSRLADTAYHEGVPQVNTFAVSGTPFLEIIREVIREEHDLVIVSAEGGSVMKNVFFGSTATHLLRKCPCPVWVIKPGQQVPYGRILAAVDPVNASEEAEELNFKIMDLATSLAMAHDAHLHVMHAWDFEGRDRETFNSEMTVNMRQSLLDRHWTMHHDAVLSLLSQYPMSEIHHEVHLPRGVVQQKITSVVEKEDIDLIVMGTVNRGRIPGFLIGHVAESVLDSVCCGVLTVKPEGFETPVTLPQVVPFNGWQGDNLLKQQKRSGQ